MAKEFESLQKNKTWKPNQKVVRCKWIFKKKERAIENEPIRLKARLVARGYTERGEIGYTKVFSLSVKHTSIIILMSLVAQKD